MHFSDKYSCHISSDVLTVIVKSTYQKNYTFCNRLEKEKEDVRIYLIIRYFDAKPDVHRNISVIIVIAHILE
jgi:hypothetical protein